MKLLYNKPTNIDVFLLSCFTIFITFQPYYLHHEIIMMETGIHLPVINALFHGAIPYKDFLFIRGPFELYVPSLFLKLFNMNMVVLPTFYYVGTILTLLIGIVIARQLYLSRFILYLMVPVFVGRTFARISYYYWGGMRYALGFLVILCAILFFKRQKSFWLFIAGILSSLALLTTVEAGASTIISVCAALLFDFIFKISDRRFLIKSFGIYVTGILCILLPYIIYLLMTGSLMPMLESIYGVVFLSNAAMPGIPGVRPEGIQFLLGMLPDSRYFKFMTPAYFYIIFGGYIFLRYRKKTLNHEVSCLIVLAIYGLILYAAAFRKIEGHHFEMALQPEKILLFFILERAYFLMKEKRALFKLKNKIAPIFIINLLILGLIMSSLGYSVTRYNRRFVMYKLLGQKLGLNQKEDLSLLKGIEKKTLTLDRAKGMVVPAWQAEEIEEVVKFLEDHTQSNEAIFCYPEVGNFNFWADRPFIGRFPIATFSWIKDDWHKELVADFKKLRPHYVIMTNLGHRTFPEEWYFRNKKNIIKFNEMTNLILNNYHEIKRYTSIAIYKRK